MPDLAAANKPDDDGQASTQLAGQPLIQVERDGVRFTLLGTAHVSQASVDAVRAILAERRFDAVAVELCESRRLAIAEPERLQQMDLLAVLREGKAGLVAAQLLLASYQARLAAQLGVEVGAEMKAALSTGREQGLPVWLVDRDVGITVGRAYRSVGFWQRLTLLGGLLGSILSRDEIDAEAIENLKQGDVLDSAFREFALQSEPLYQALIAERDSYMAARLRELAAATPQARDVLVVIGAGHLQGLAKLLQEQQQAPAPVLAELRQPPPPSRWPRWLGYALIALIVGGFGWAFAQSGEVGLELLLVYVLATGLLGALGCALAGGHPASIGAAFLASPITPLHPALASGTVSAAVELWMRKPTVRDFASLRTDLDNWRGWWRNGVSRILLNFFLTSLGTGIGVWLTGVRVFQALIRT
ncbi:MAG: TraB/GumN family protein [Xanthomonadales bacterium]|nr:TraB/GumN family protein [Xanthomonadales bacterium]